MKPSDLVKIVRRLAADQPITDALEGRTADGYPGPHRNYYSSQREHFLSFLGEYDTPGAYGRTTFDGTAHDWYQRFQCAPGLVWLAEALGEDADVLEAAVAAIRAAGPRAARQSAAFRRLVPWSRVEELLAQRRTGPFRR